MADDPDRPKETPDFETNTVEADRARGQGLGFGERELNAQGDPGGVRTRDEEPTMENGASLNAEDDDALNQSIGVQGSADGERRRADDV